MVMICSMNNARDRNYFTKFFINGWCVEWLLVNKNVILMVDLDENQSEVGHCPHQHFVKIL